MKRVIVASLKSKDSESLDAISSAVAWFLDNQVLGFNNLESYFWATDKSYSNSGITLEFKLTINYRVTKYKVHTFDPLQVNIDIDKTTLEVLNQLSPEDLKDYIDELESKCGQSFKAWKKRRINSANELIASWDIKAYTNDSEVFRQYSDTSYPLAVSTTKAALKQSQRYISDRDIGIQAKYSGVIDILTVSNPRRYNQLTLF